MWSSVRLLSVMPPAEGWPEITPTARHQPSVRSMQRLLPLSNFRRWYSSTWSAAARLAICNHRAQKSTLVTIRSVLALTNWFCVCVRFKNKIKFHCESCNIGVSRICRLLLLDKRKNTCKNIVVEIKREKFHVVPVLQRSSKICNRSPNYCKLLHQYNASEKRRFITTLHIAHKY